MEFELKLAVFTAIIIMTVIMGFGIVSVTA
ncbi:YnhF family membrane protein [Photobacterium lutimaris]|uniref:YnhF family membrane protein n=1 Tax=Photobacterium lutimaris TaxID=388278 RepID=A0A2T3J057_9GAMM|nr:YnhF family membrane protein [Photobacterium lutimaris]PSU34323.1 YnhF family membrane protein [Photobacterium lutimaris]TDR75914.1 hypothetical protein DFP78_104277 [Photobacterium lutimaris]